MVATGFTWYVGTYGATMNPLADRLAYGFQGWFEAFLAWLVLAYPTGRLRPAASRWVIGAFFGLLIVRAVVRIAVFRVSTDYDLGVPTEVDRYVADLALRDAADTVFRVGIAGLAVAVIVLLVVRLRTETDLGRRLAWPMLLGGVAFIASIVVETWTLLVAGSFAERSFAWDLGLVLTTITGVLVPIAFLVGLARARLARGVVADLVVELGDARDSRTLDQAIARAVGDPSLQVAYATDSGVFVDARGEPFAPPATDDEKRATTRLDIGGRTVAVLVHDVALADQPELLESVAAAAGLAIENGRLAADVRAQLEEVRRSRERIVVAGDAERRRLERDIHDGAQQRLVTLALMLQSARSRLGDADPELSATLAGASAQLEAALAELRRLARGLHPALLSEEGLASAVDGLVDRTPLPVRVKVGDGRWPPAVEAAAYYVVAESLTNAVKHANAASIDIAIAERGGQLIVEVTDDGAGGASARPGSGIAGLDDRVAAAGGRLAVRSEPGRGTTVRAEIPVG